MSRATPNPAAPASRGAAGHAPSCHCRAARVWQNTGAAGQATGAPRPLQEGRQAVRPVRTEAAAIWRH